jgi:hypothetical protein
VNLETLQIEPISELSSLVESTGNPSVTNLDLSSEGEVIFTYGIVDATIYHCHFEDYSEPTPIAKIDHSSHFLGWLELVD